jgi:hypothetical protein
MSPRFVPFENDKRVENSQVRVLPQISFEEFNVFGLTVGLKVIFKQFLKVLNCFAILSCAFLERGFFIYYSYFASKYLKKFYCDSTESQKSEAQCDSQKYSKKI